MINSFWHRPDTLKVRDLDSEIEEADLAQHWFIREIRRRNFPPPGEPEASTVILISGDLRSSKSTTAAKLIIGAGDSTYLPSLENHPANGGHTGDDWKCHLSVSPGPFIDAIAYELKQLKAGLPQEYLVPGSFWHIDEPSEMKSTEWYTQLAKDVSDTIMENAFLKINVIICTPVKGRILSMLRELSNIWIRMYRPGWGMVHRFKSRINYKSASRPEIRVPEGVCPIVDTVDPRDSKVMRSWMDLYQPIKLWNAENHAAIRSARWKETKKKQSRKRQQLVDPTKDVGAYVS